VKWEKFVPWLEKNELWVFLVPLAFLIAVGVNGCFPH
jgi:hypothetical protein